MRILAQVGAVLGLSTLLALSFNSSNPIGISFQKTPATVQTNALAAAPEPSKPAAPPPLAHNIARTNLSAVTWPEVRPLAEAGSVLLLDVRSRDAFDMGHIPGAVWFPILAPPEKYAELTNQYAADVPIVAYCAGGACNSSLVVAFRLVMDYGFKSVFHMPGGYPEWQQAQSQSNGGPATAVAAAVAQQPIGTTGQDPSKPWASATTWLRTKSLLATNKLVLVDARPKPAYEAAHIPDAVSLPEGSPPEAIDEFRKQYPTNTHLVVYCSSVHCSASKRLADKLMQQFGYSTVEFMTGGFLEWQQEQLAPQAQAQAQAAK
jgi:rhodanese-related sulfurtransferase